MRYFWLELLIAPYVLIGALWFFGCIIGYVKAEDDPKERRDTARFALMAPLWPIFAAVGLVWFFGRLVLDALGRRS